LWMREHNRLAEQLAAKHPRWGDERLYQEARRWVVAEMQAITYNEFLPAVLGPNAPQAYHGYDPHLRPDISNEFAAAAFRVGHTMLPTHLLRVDASGNEIPAGHLALRDGFFQPQAVREAGVEVLLRGLARQQQQEIDAQIVDDVRNFMFGQPGAGGLDLASLNIQRGREHGLPSYNQLRATVGLDPVTRFSEITGDPLVAQQLAATYDTVDDVDAWVGGICEDHLTGSSLGETFTRIWVEQFTRTRAADRFWFENVFHGKELRQLQNLRLADVLAANGVSGPLQANVFFTPSTLTVRAAAKTALDITVRVRTDGAEQVEIYDNVRRQVIAQQALSATKRVFIQGGSRNDRITIAPAFPLPIEVLGGEGMDSLDYRGTEHNDAVDIYFRQLQSDTAASLNYGQVEQLNVFGGAGDDRLQVHGRSEARLALLGNAGNDTLLGGEDADILSGGAGNDLLWGGGGKDWLLAGRGRDRLLTGHGRNRDLTVYWATPLDDNAHALQTLFSMWSVVYRLR
ncbi:MAG: peroxidase, partial [Planctomycetales bacterium]|nr:peroxidase [Planctomycetales bacterium]